MVYLLACHRLNLGREIKGLWDPDKIAHQLRTSYGKSELFIQKQSHYHTWTYDEASTLPQLDGEDSLHFYLEFIKNSATFGLAKLRGQSLKINVLSGSFKAPQLLYVVVIAKLRFSSPYTCRDVETWGQGGQSPLKIEANLSYIDHFITKAATYDGPLKMKRRPSESSLFPREKDYFQHLSSFLGVCRTFCLFISPYTFLQIFRPSYGHA